MNRERVEQEVWVTEPTSDRSDEQPAEPGDESKINDPLTRTEAGDEVTRTPWGESPPG